MVADVPKVVFFGNCQADMLSVVYKRYLDYGVRFRTIYADAQAVTTDAAFAAKALAEADIVVEQIFDRPTKVKLDNLRAGCKVIRFPSVIGGFYWPYGSQIHFRAPKGVANPPYPKQLGDRYLNRLIEKDTDPEEALRIYSDLDVAADANLDRLLELSLYQQERRDAQCGFNVASVLQRFFREEHLFLTPDHPDLRVFFELARPVYGELGFSASAVDDALASLVTAPFPRSQMPIHPRVIDHFKLKFADKATQYVFRHEGRFTFAEFVLRYMKHEWNEDLDDALFGGNELQGRLEKLEQNLTTSPRSAAGWREHANILLRLGQPTKAVPSAERACELDPVGLDLRVSLVRAHLASGDLDQAERTAVEFGEVFPRAALAHIIRAEVALRQNDQALALHHARLAARFEKGNPHTRWFLGHVAAASGKLAEAESAYRAASMIQPRHANHWINLAEVLERQERLGEAESVLEEAINAVSHSELVQRQLDRVRQRKDEAVRLCIMNPSVLS